MLCYSYRILSTNCCDLFLDKITFGAQLLCYLPNRTGNLDKYSKKMIENNKRCAKDFLCGWEEVKALAIKSEVTHSLVSNPKSRAQETSFVK